MRKQSDFKPVWNFKIVRFGNRSTTNCRIRWSDATKAGFYSGGRSSWWLPGFFGLNLFSFSGHNVLFTFPQSVGCSLVTCQGFSTPPWTNSGLSITRKTRGSSSLPPAMTSTGSRSTWCKNKTRIFSSLMSFWQQVGRPFPTIGLYNIFLFWLNISIQYLSCIYLCYNCTLGSWPTCGKMIDWQWKAPKVGEQISQFSACKAVLSAS